MGPNPNFLPLVPAGCKQLVATLVEVLREAGHELDEVAGPGADVDLV